MTLCSADIVREAALRLRVLEAAARSRGHDDVARASAILAAPYEEAERRIAAGHA